MFQIIAKSLTIATRMDRPNPCLPREADLPRLNAPVGWGSLNRPHCQPPRKTRSISLVAQQV